MASGTLTLALGFVLLAGVVSGFRRYRTVDYFLNRLQARRQPHAGPPPPKGRMFAPDPVFLKYALGLTDPTIDQNLFDLLIASEAYFNLFKVTGDPKLVASQFARTDILQHLLDINKCFSTKAIRLVVVGIASYLQDAIEQKLNELEPELEKILPELPAGDPDIKDKAPKILTILLIKSTVFSFLPKIADLGYLKDFRRIVEESLIRNANNHLFDFVRDMADFKTANPPPTCKPLAEVSRLLKDFIQKLPESFSTEILPIIAKLRKAMDLHGIGLGTLPVNDLLDTLEPEILHLTDEYKPVGTTDGLEGFLGSAGIPLPADLTSPIDPSNPFNQIFREVSREWIGDNGPLREFINRLKNPDDEADGDGY